MPWRFITPNKPIRAGEDFLDTVDDRYAMDVKLDGYRTEVGKFDGRLHALSKQGADINLPPDILAFVNEWTPEGTAFDCEWLNPVRLKALNTELGTKFPLVHRLSIFDVTWNNGKYLKTAKLEDRRKKDIYRLLPTVELEEVLTGQLVFQCPSYNGNDPHAFFQIQRTIPISEGVVIKKLNGGLASNWFKVKYR